MGTPLQHNTDKWQTLKKTYLIHVFRTEKYGKWQEKYEDEDQNCDADPSADRDETASFSKNSIKNIKLRCYTVNFY